MVLIRGKFIVNRFEPKSSGTNQIMCLALETLRHCTSKMQPVLTVYVSACRERSGNCLLAQVFCWRCWGLMIQSEDFQLWIERLNQVTGPLLAVCLMLKNVYSCWASVPRSWAYWVWIPKTAGLNAGTFTVCMCKGFELKWPPVVFHNKSAITSHCRSS